MCRGVLASKLNAKKGMSYYAVARPALRLSREQTQEKVEVTLSGLFNQSSIVILSRIKNRGILKVN